MSQVTRSDRRRFLRQMGTLGGLGVASGTLGLLNWTRLAAAAEVPTDYKAMVCIFLFGGNDSYNCLAPSDPDGYDTYAVARRSLAIPREDLLPLADPGHIDPQGRSFGLNPVMSALHPLYQEGKLAFTLNIGPLIHPMTKAQYRDRSVPRPPSLQSHSDQQFQTQTAGVFDSDAGYTGWHGRVADIMDTVSNQASTFTNVSLAGNNVIQVGAAVSPYSVDNQGNLDAPISQHVGGGLQQRLRNGVERLLFASPHVFANAYGEVKRQALDGNAALAEALAGTMPPEGFPNSSLARQLQTVAQVMNVAPALGIRRQTFFCSIGGFDTHSNQQNSHPRLLATVAEAMAAFYGYTQSVGLADKVTTFTASEFARTFAMNGNLGTDHAWGGNQLVLGGGVRGGLYGSFPDLTLNGPDDVGNEGRFIATTAVDQVASTLALWFGVSPGELGYVTPNIGNFDTDDLGFMG